MNLWLRLCYLILVCRWRARVAPLEACETPFRCWPTDLDPLLHMNNAKYLAVMDLARVDMIVRCGMWGKLKSRGQYPIVEAQSIRYRKSIQLFKTFKIVTRVVGWDEKSFFVRQAFMCGSEVMAEAVVKGRFLKKSRGTVPPADLMEEAGGGRVSPRLDDFITAWNEGLLGS